MRMESQKGMEDGKLVDQQKQDQKQTSKNPFAFSQTSVQTRSMKSASKSQEIASPTSKLKPQKNSKRKPQKNSTNPRSASEGKTEVQVEEEKQSKSKKRQSAKKRSSTSDTPDLTKYRSLLVKYKKNTDRANRSPESDTGPIVNIQECMTTRPTQKQPKSRPSPRFPPMATRKTPRLPENSGNLRDVSSSWSRLESRQESLRTSRFQRCTDEQLAVFEKFPLCGEDKLKALGKEKKSKKNQRKIEEIHDEMGKVPGVRMRGSTMNPSDREEALAAAERRNVSKLTQLSHPDMAVTWEE